MTGVKELYFISFQVERNCTAAVAPKKITDAVKNAVKSDDRSRDVIIYGEECEGENFDTKVFKILNNVNETPSFDYCVRIEKRAGTIYKWKYLYATQIWIVRSQ